MWPCAHDGSPCGCGQVLESAHAIVVAVVDLALNIVVVVVVVEVLVTIGIGESAAAAVVYVVRTLAVVGPAPQQRQARAPKRTNATPGLAAPLDHAWPMVVGVAESSSQRVH